MALSDNDKRQSQDQARTDREKKLAKMQGFSVLVLLQILLIVLTAMTGNASQGSVTCIFSTLYLLLVYLLPFEWDSIRNFVFWVQYAMCLPVVLCVTNMLIQRRDDLTNVVMILIALVISLSAMASDFARIACGKGIPDAASQVFCWTWLSNLVAVTFLLNTSSPLFPRTSFSNAESVVSVVLPAMLLIPILQGVNLKNTSLDEGDTTLLRILIDTFARAVLTVAVACDLFGMSFADNVIIS